MHKQTQLFMPHRLFKGLRLNCYVKRLWMFRQKGLKYNNRKFHGVVSLNTLQSSVTSIRPYRQEEVGINLFRASNVSSRRCWSNWASTSSPAGRHSSILSWSAAMSESSVSGLQECWKPWCFCDRTEDVDSPFFSPPEKCGLQRYCTVFLENGTNRELTITGFYYWPWK